jgi:hypothetical protein
LWVASTFWLFNNQSAPVKVYREKLKCHRGDYFASYQPADSRLRFATLSLVFLNNASDCSRVATAMEFELEHWLNRFPVPIMVSSFDVKDDLIRVKGCRDDDHLMGVPSKMDGIIKRWGTYRDDEISTEFTNDKYLERIYVGVAHQSVEEVAQKATTEAAAIRRAALSVLLLVVLVPLAIQFATLGIVWFGYVVSIISIIIGCYKGAKTFGWIKPSLREKQKAEKRSRMEHYFYHCERNPKGFNRLKIENFERELIEETHKEAAAILDKPGDSE